MVTCRSPEPPSFRPNVLIEAPGPVFRVSPNELSFGSATSWKAIYGSPGPGKLTLIKSDFYDMYGAGFDSLCIGSERDPKTHSQMKRTLSAAFSTKALAEQEDIIQRCINAFVEKVGSKRTLDISEWYEMVAFDILGEMAFGESFHCIAKGAFTIHVVGQMAYSDAQRNTISGSISLRNTFSSLP